VGQVDNPLHDELLRRRNELGLSEVVSFAGFRTDVADLYRAFDVYVLTSHSEGFPLSMIQAMASGLPVVATRCGGPEEMVEHGVNGLLTALGSGDAAADALDLLIHDSAMRSRMGNCSRDLAVTRFSTAAMVSAYQEMYQQLVAPPSRSGATGRGSAGSVDQPLGLVKQA
jgi:glycosyltransferase involved in cell wall biosynthesis